MRHLLIALCLLGFGSAVSVAAPTPKDSSYVGEEALRRYMQGRSLEESGEYSQALREYYRVLLLDPRAGTVARRVSELTARMGDARRSLEYAERALETMPQDGRSLWLKGSALFNLDRPDEAFTVLQAAFLADSTDPEILRTMARAAESRQRVDWSVRAWRQIVDIDDTDAEAWFQLAVAECANGNFDAADKAIKQAVDLNPMRPGSFFVQGWIREGQNRNAEAIEFYRQHLEVHEGDLATRKRLVQLLAEEKRFGEAHKEATKVASASPRDEFALEVQADLAFKAGKGSEGSKTCEKLAMMSVENTAALFRAVDVLERNGKKDQAVSLADRWAKTSHLPWKDLAPAQARAMVGDWDGATSRVNKIAAAYPDSIQPLLVLGRIHTARKQWKEAEVVWADVAKRFPGRADVHLDLARTREEQGNDVGAEAAARDALALAPTDPRVLNFLGYLLADHNRSLEEALGLIRRALDKDPNNGAYVDSMGWVYYRLGRLEEARKELERAVTLTGGDPVVHEHLGDVYKDMRLKELAKEQYKLSLQGDDTSRVRTKLEGLR
jgi:tetratricopeptide (TPR) repeat protein